MSKDRGSQEIITDFGNLKSCYCDQVPGPVGHYAPERLNGLIYGLKDIQGFVRIQRMFRRIKKLEQTIRTYRKICPSGVKNKTK